MVLKVNLGVVMLADPVADGKDGGLAQGETLRLWENGVRYPFDFQPSRRSLPWKRIRVSERGIRVSLVEKCSRIPAWVEFIAWMSGV